MYNEYEVHYFAIGGGLGTALGLGMGTAGDQAANERTKRQRQNHVQYVLRILAESSGAPSKMNRCV